MQNEEIRPLRNSGLTQDRQRQGLFCWRRFFMGIGELLRAVPIHDVQHERPVAAAEAKIGEVAQQSSDEKSEISAAKRRCTGEDEKDGDCQQDHQDEQHFPITSKPLVEAVTRMIVEEPDTQNPELIVCQFHGKSTL